MSQAETESIHQSVLLDECVAILNAEEGGLFVDATLGLGGHSEGILSVSETSRVIGIDQDKEALSLAVERLTRFGTRFLPVQSNFASIANVVNTSKLGEPDGILADLGVSSLQLDSDSRGFSFRFDAPLDMRMDQDSDDETAAELIDRLSHEELANIIYNFGEERASRKIARWIIEKRDAGTPITTTFELAELVRRAVKTNPKDRTHPATRTFQALRIAVNHELDILKQFIFDSVEVLKTNGVLAIITFHSLEDRIVKHAFQLLAGKCQCPPRIPQCICGAAKKVEILTRKPILPSEFEMERNSRSRSAKLRACRKLEN
ncbi:MAG: 16S rRNA (cytosine(1402)-N(4))-methyltransferase RsmH [Acidobacteria bacterium]|nr:16S rRNA (cytosine(1402)-N(4))-methyltransferase RsmH [Acidobacteriota bacterium]